MASPQLQKRWRVTTAILKRARRAIPDPTQDARAPFFEITKRFDDWIEHNELGLALDELEELGDLVQCRGGFWRDMERAAEVMKLKERAQYFHHRFLSSRPVA